MNTNKIKYWVLRVLFFIVISSVLCLSIAFIYVLIFGPILDKRDSMPRWIISGVIKWFIIGGGGYYSLIYANKISARITNRFVMKRTTKEDEKGTREEEKEE